MGGAKDIGDHPHMTSLFLRGEGVHKIVTLSDVRGGGLLKKVTSLKMLSFIMQITFCREKNVIISFCTDYVTVLNFSHKCDS